MVGKRRTRQHVIADLSVHHVEGIALRAGYTVQRFDSDYGLDLLLRTYNRRGEPEAGYILLQVKATDHLARRSDGSIAIVLDRRDIKQWTTEIYPVLLVLYDAQADRAFWVHVQEHLEFSRKGGNIPFRAYRSLRMPEVQILNRETLVNFAQQKRKMHRQVGRTYK